MPAASAPWTVALAAGPKLNRDFVCAGALIAAHWVLTAAHCIYNFVRRWPTDDSAYVFTHVTSLSSSSGHRHSVLEIIMHPKYNARTLRNDLALIKFDGEGSSGLPISLDGPSISEQVGAIGSIIGWGISTAQSGRQHSELLHVIQTAVLDEGVCFSARELSRATGNARVLRAVAARISRRLLPLRRQPDGLLRP